MARARSITVAVGRFDEVLGRGLLQILRDARGVRVVGSARDPAALQAVVARGKAQVVILDEDSAATTSLTGRLREARPDVGLVALVHRPSRAYAIRMIALGVNVCLSTGASPAEVLEAVRVAAAGRHMLVSMSIDPAQSVGGVDIWSLTGREREVLGLLARGHKNAEIAQALNISTETARTHAKHVYRKLGVSSRGELLGVGG